MSFQMKSSTDESSNSSSISSSISYQLTHSLVKPFKPKMDYPLLDLNGTAIERHVCQQCLDTFLFESSLKCHLERRSVKISYFCDKCKLRLNFFNRCALLSHIGSHNENKSDKLQVSQVFVTPLPLTQILAEGVAEGMAKGMAKEMTAKHTLHYKNITIDNNVNNNCNKDNKRSDNSIIDKTIENNSTINSNQSVESHSLQREQNNKNTSNEINETISTGISNNLIKKKILIKKSSQISSELKCSECNTSLSSVSVREQHFVQNIEMVLPSNQCKICPIICPTKCSQTVHNRLHYDNKKNLICPECGAKCDDLKETDFITHIIISCLHFSRRLVYECIFCSNRMSSLSAFIQHIKSLHTKQYFQCSQCSFKYENDLKLKEHQTNSHPNDMRRNLIFKCPICETELMSSNSYFEHISNHQKKLCGFAKFLFVCHQCNQSFVNKNDLKLHFNESHIHSKSQFETKAFFNKLTKEISVQFRLRIGTQCETYTNNTDSSVVKPNTEKRNISQLNGDQNSINGRPVKHQMIENKTPVTNNSQTCIKEDESNSNAQKPINPKLFKCKECGLTFPVIQTLKRHLILEHRIHDVETYVNKVNVEIPVLLTEPQLPKEVGERKLSEILDNEESTDTMCPICSLKFSDSKELKVHGRVHGMAFIKSCQKKTT